MSTILQRFQRILNANAHMRLDQLEQPEAMLNQLQRETLTAIAQAKAALVQSKVWRQRLKDRLMNAENALVAAQRAAESALQDKDEAMAHAAMQRKLDKQAESQQLQKQLTRMEATTAKQTQQLDRLRQSLTALREKRAELIQRQRFAQALNAANAAANDLPEPCGAVLERLEEKICLQEAAAESYGDTPDEQPDLDEFIRQQNVNEELAVLRQHMEKY